MMRSRGLALALVGALAAGCTARNPVYCESEVDCTDPSRPFCDRAGEYGASKGFENTCIPEPGCRRGACEGRTPVCRLEIEACAACEVDGDCTSSPTGGRCAADGTCVECAESADCDSLACHPIEQRCVAAAEVLYVDASFPAASNCTRSAPCGDLRWALALAGPGRSVLRVAAGHYPASLQTAKAVMLIGDPETVISPAPGDTRATLLVDDAVVILHGVTVSGEGGGGGLAAIRCEAPAGATPSHLVLLNSRVTGAPGAGIDAQRCRIEIDGSTIAGSGGPALQVIAGSLDLTRSEIVDNAGGGLVVTSSLLLLRNSVLARNGTPDGPVGGAFFGPLEAGSRVEHNTIVDNRAAGGAAGVFCWNQDILVNNIVYGNAEGAQIAGCRSRYSLIGPIAEAGAGNVDQEPIFLPPDARGEYHLDPRSPGVDQGESSGVRDDIDGDARPQGGGFDMGADEVPR